jgi:hypothetical protein
MIDLIHDPAKESTVESLGQRVANIARLNHVAFSLYFLALLKYQG